MEKNKSSEDLPPSSVVMAEKDVTSSSSGTQPTLMFGSSATIGKIETKSALFEFGNSPVKPDLSSGFNSADSTNDEDFFTTKEAVQSAIEVMDRGVQDEEEDKICSKSKDEEDNSRGKEIESKEDSTKNVEVIESNSLETKETESNSSYLSKENKEGTQQLGSNIKKDIPINDKQDKNGLENLLQRESTDDDKLKENISVDDKSLKASSEKEDSELIESECSETKNITNSGDTQEILIDTTEDESKSDQNKKVKIDVDENKDNKQECETSNVVIVLSGTEQPENNCEVKEHKDLESHTSTNLNEDTSIDVNDKTPNDTLIVTQAIEDIKISPSVTESCTSNAEVMDIETHSSPPPKVEEFVEKTEDGSEIAITLENFEVSVFEEGSTDHLATGILELLKDENGKSVSIESKPTEMATKEKIDEFKLDEAVSSSEEDSDAGSNLKETTAEIDSSKQEVDKDSSKHDAFKLDDGVVSSGDEIEEQVVHNTKENPNSDENLMNQTKESDAEVELMEVEDKVSEKTEIELMEVEDKASEKELSILETEEPLVTIMAIDKKDSIEEDEINENYVGGSVSSKSIEESTTGIQTSVDGKSSEEKQDSLSKSVSNETEIAECLISESTDENADKKQSDDELSDTSANADLIDLMRSALANNEEFRRNFSLELEEPSCDKEGSEDCSKADESTAKETEVISLVDDDEDESNRRKKPAAALKCVNPNCMSGEGLEKTAMFVLTYFGLKRAKDQQVCEECFNIVMEHQEKLAGLLKEGKPLFSADFPSHRDVILLDSDEESISDNESVLSEDTMQMIHDNLDDVIAESLANFGLDHQIRESCDYLNNMVDRLEVNGVKYINQQKASGYEKHSFLFNRE
ncbi:hypothetical protein J6590_087226 [Homalodisca vitripennis]|nr:hypothetical protein J6590_087226 [Homalodisca vitripennis]